MRDKITDLSLYCDQISTLLACHVIHCVPSETKTGSVITDHLPSLFSNYFYLQFQGLNGKQFHENTITHIASNLGIHFSLCYLSTLNRLVCIGPYLIRPADPTFFHELTKKLGLTVEERIEYTNFYKLIPLCIFSKTEAAIRILLHAFSCEEKEAIEYIEETILPLHIKEPVEDQSTEENFDSITKRYASENNYMDALAQGKFADMNFSQAFPMYVKLDARSTDPVRDIKIFSTILNTLSRKAVERAGIHPYYIDLISSKIAIQIEAAKTVDEVNAIVQKIPKQYSELVLKHTVKEHSPLIRKTLHYIALHLHRELSLEEIAEKMGVHSTYLSKQFNKEVKISLSNYINEKRIQEAEKLLKTTKKSIAEIAMELSYHEVNYFTKVFKKITGKTPTEYRNSLENYRECHR